MSRGRGIRRRDRAPTRGARVGRETRGQAAFGAGVVVCFTPWLAQASLLMVPALPLTLVASVAYGVVTIRRRLVPRDGGGLLVAAVVLVVPLCVVLGHNAAAMVGHVVTWARGAGRW